MTRRERAVKSMPTWMLRTILAMPLMQSWWSAAYVELWVREVEDVVAETADEVNGPWVVSPILGRH